MRSEPITITIPINLEILLVPARPMLVPDDGTTTENRARPGRPPLTGDEHESGRARDHHKTTSSSQTSGTSTNTPWWPTTHDWPYPDPHHPSSRDFPRNSVLRTHRCPTCGAPPDAHCLTRNDRLVAAK